jgi:hypothetical protein
MFKQFKLGAHTERMHGHTVFMYLPYKETLSSAEAKYDFSCSSGRTCLILCQYMWDLW